MTTAPRIVGEQIKRPLLAWLRECAEAGRPCPKNMEICARFGLASQSTAAGLLSRLELDGSITVERFARDRVVYIVGTDLSTRRPPNESVHTRGKSSAARPADAPPPPPRPPALRKSRGKIERLAPLPPEIYAAAREDGRPLTEFVRALIEMGLECWRDDRREDVA